MVGIGDCAIGGIVGGPCVGIGSGIGGRPGTTPGAWTAPGAIVGGIRGGTLPSGGRGVGSTAWPFGMICGCGLLASG
jgi:hypothetical protein